jgi:hypothetical protein
LLQRDALFYADLGSTVALQGFSELRDRAAAASAEVITGKISKSTRFSH